VADRFGLGGEAAALREGYELLRQAVLSGSPGGWRLGHGVLSAGGMARWMSAFDELAPPPAGATAAPRLSSESPLSASAELLADIDQVVAVLAQMTLAIAA
jgi:hypothetical protein